MSRKFYTLDVFTNEALSGNPLAVVLDSAGLDDAMMQNIAKEFNLSETVFVSPPTDSENRAALRIFTPDHELPFAGHPTVGTAVLLNQLNHLGEENEFVLEERVGPVACTVTSENNVSTARFDLPKVSSRVAFDLNQKALANALGLTEGDFGFDDQTVSVWDGGVPYVLMPVCSIEAVRKVVVDAQAINKLEPVVNGIRANTYLYCLGGDKGTEHIHARMFAPSAGIPEDAATGSAVAALSGQLAHTMMGTDEHRTFTIEQGYEMGRPSMIYLDIEKRNGTVVNAGISGGAVIVSEGQLHL